MPRCNTACCFFIKSLIVIETHAIDAHEFSGNSCESFAENKFFDLIILKPEIHDLKKRFFIRSTFLHWFREFVEFEYPIGDDLTVVVQNIRAQYVFEFYISFLSVEINGGLREGVYVVEFA